jgi:hypothetical protein
LITIGNLNIKFTALLGLSLKMKGVVLMESIYIKPSLVNYGNSLKLIKGECNWGTENAYLDKTGFYERNWWHWVWKTVPAPGGPVNVRVCEYGEACSNQDQCTP